MTEAGLAHLLSEPVRHELFLRFTARERQVYRLRVVEGRTQARTAAMLGVNASGVSQIEKRLRDKLRLAARPYGLIPPFTRLQRKVYVLLRENRSRASIMAALNLRGCEFDSFKKHIDRKLAAVEAADQAV